MKLNYENVRKFITWWYQNTGDATSSCPEDLDHLAKIISDLIKENWPEPENIARMIRDAIREEVQITMRAEIQAGLLNLKAEDGLNQDKPSSEKEVISYGVQSLMEVFVKYSTDYDLTNTLKFLDGAGMPAYRTIWKLKNCMGENRRDA